MSEIACNIKENKNKQEKFILSQENFPETLPSYLLNSKKYAFEMENVHKQPFYQRNLVADLLINKGAKNYNMGLVEEATICLEKALSVLLFVLYMHNNNPTSYEKRLILKEYIPTDSQEKNIFLKQKLAIFNILLFCYLELKHYNDAFYACDESLKLEPQQDQVIYFKQLISYMSNKGQDKPNSLLIKDLKSNYLLLDDKLKHFVESKFENVIQTINKLEETYNKAINYTEDVDNNYQLPTINQMVKPKKNDLQAINSQQFLIKLPFWVSVIVIVMIISTYFF